MSLFLFAIISSLSCSQSADRYKEELNFTSHEAEKLYFTMIHENPNISSSTFIQLGILKNTENLHNDRDFREAVQLSLALSTQGDADMAKRLQEAENQRFQSENNAQKAHVKKKEHPTLPKQQLWHEIKTKGITQPAQLQIFKEIYSHLEGIQQDSDVHALDHFVFGVGGKITSLLALGQTLSIDNPGLTWGQIQQAVTVLAQAKGTKGVDYLKVLYKNDVLLPWIQKHFGNISNELNAYPHRREEIRQLWSRLVTLTQRMDVFDENVSNLLLQCIIENYVTAGGCLQGRINRGFVRYVSLLGSLGLRHVA